MIPLIMPTCNNPAATLLTARIIPSIMLNTKRTDKGGKVDGARGRRKYLFESTLLSPSLSEGGSGEDDDGGIFASFAGANGQDDVADGGGTLECNGGGGRDAGSG